MRVIMLLFFFCGVSLAGIVHEKRTYERREDVDGTTFTFQSIIDDGVVSEQYHVADQPVDKGTYEQRVSQAHEGHAALVAQHITQIPLDESIKSRMALKIVHMLAEAIKKQLRQLGQLHIKQFIAFRPETIDNQQSLDRIMYQLVPALAFIQEPGASAQSAQLLCSLGDKIQQVHDRLVQLYADTLEAVLARGDDPKTLRQLLEGMNHLPV